MIFQPLNFYDYHHKVGINPCVYKCFWQWWGKSRKSFIIVSSDTMPCGVSCRLSNVSSTGHSFSQGSISLTNVTFAHILWFHNSTAWQWVESLSKSPQLGILDNFGQFWIIFDNFAVLDYFGLCWTILDNFGHFGQLWTVLDNCGQFWTIVDNFGNCGQLWTILDNWGQFWAILIIFLSNLDLLDVFLTLWTFCYIMDIFLSIQPTCTVSSCNLHCSFSVTEKTALYWLSFRFSFPLSSIWSPQIIAPHIVDEKSPIATNS
jgi:hypothetical protein